MAGVGGLADVMVVITLQYRNVSNQHLHALSLDSVIDLLWLSKAGKIESSSQVQCKRSNVGRAVGSQGDSAICVTSWELLGCHSALLGGGGWPRREQGALRPP